MNRAAYTYIDRAGLDYDAELVIVRSPHPEARGALIATSAGPVVVPAAHAPAAARAVLAAAGHPAGTALIPGTHMPAVRAALALLVEHHAHPVGRSESEAAQGARAALEWATDAPVKTAPIKEPS